MNLKFTRPIVVCGPSGSGKSTLVRRLMNEFPDKFGFCVSHTTRKPRLNELKGVHYHFTGKKEMQKAIKLGEFIEYARFGENLYGTSKAAVDAVMSSQKICILDIDIQGAKQIKNSDLHPWYIFIVPPSLEELCLRLTARNTETEQSLAYRLKAAEEELVYGKTPGNFHLIITNDDLENAYHGLKTFIEENILKNNSFGISTEIS